MSRKTNNKKFDFDCRISQRFGLPYKDYLNSDGNFHELLEFIGRYHDYSIEWDKKEKKFIFTVYENDFIGVVYKGDTLKESVLFFFHAVLNNEININVNQ